MQTIRSSAHDLVPVDFKASSLKLIREGVTPSSGFIERGINDPSKIGGNLDVSPLQCANPLSPESPDKVSEFQHYILPSTRFRRFTFFVSLVVRS